MTPRKHRKRYIKSAALIASRLGAEAPTEWADVWDFLDKHEEVSYVYAIVNSHANTVKFGRSVNPWSRIHALQTASPVELSLFAFCHEDDQISERIAHQQMAEHRIMGEWFRLNDATRQLIDTIRVKGLRER